MRNLNFDDMHLFARVAELGTLSAVARERDVPVSQVSRTLNRLEKTCAARLIHRSTHGLARWISVLRRRLYATPGYLQTFGTPQHPDELRLHRLISNSGVAMLNHWPFIVKGKPAVIVADGCWRSDNTGMTARLTLQGLGISRFATLVAEPLVQRGLLVAVLPGFVDEQPSPIHAVTLSGRHRLPKIRVCIDYWAEWFDRGAGSTEAP